MTKNEEPAPSGASSLFGCGLPAADVGDRDRSDDAPAKEIERLKHHLLDQKQVLAKAVKAIDLIVLDLHCLEKEIE